jgi:hypothetical protein
MKTAVIISGDARTFHECYPSFQSNILNYNRCDVFLHLYNDCDKRTVLDTYKPTSYISEDRDAVHVDIDPECNINKPSEINPVSVFCQWRNIKKAFSLVDSSYDCILKTRYDIKYTNPLVLSDYDMNHVNVPIGGDWRGGLFDMMAFSSYQNMEKYCSLYENINSYAKSGVPCHSEILNKHNLQVLGCIVRRFSYTVLLRRQFDRGYVEDRVFTL